MLDLFILCYVLAILNNYTDQKVYIMLKIMLNYMASEHVW